MYFHDRKVMASLKHILIKAEDLFDPIRVQTFMSLMRSLSTETGAACWELNILANQIRTQAKWKQSKAIVLNRFFFRGCRGFALFQWAHKRLSDGVSLSQGRIRKIVIFEFLFVARPKGRLYLGPAPNPGIF